MWPRRYECIGGMLDADLSQEPIMNEETFNLSMRSFLKKVGINAQRAIEGAVDEAIKNGSIKGTESFPATVTLEIAGLKLKVNIDDTIKLE